jgi:hypothetical protein
VVVGRAEGSSVLLSQSVGSSGAQYAFQMGEKLIKSQVVRSGWGRSIRAEPKSMGTFT